MNTIALKHEIHIAHRLYRHVGKCKNLHGHSYKFEFFCSSNGLNESGMVADFSEVKDILAGWLDKSWDHRLMIFHKDPIANQLKELDNSIVITSFNPTVENISKKIIEEIAPKLLKGKNYRLTKLIVHETSKCSAISIIEMDTKL
jgi:6-pyruvoyltetrahydropterin/6-carboxytetrahydropterin synthase